MANKRVRKKQSKQNEIALTEVLGQSSSVNGTRKIALQVPCPSCRHHKLERTYIPRLGSLNGTVRCGRCTYSAPFLSIIADDMAATDPLPGTFGQRTRTQVVKRPVRSGFQSFLRWLAGQPNLVSPTQEYRVAYASAIDGVA